MRKTMWRIWQLGTHSLVTLVVLVAVLAGLVIAGQKFWEANATNIQYSVFALRAAHFAYGMDKFYDSLPDARIEVEETEKVGGSLGSYWGMGSNSKVLTILTMTALPFFTYENIVDVPVIPRAMGFQPFAHGDDAMHIGGQASCTDSIFIINWAFANRFDPRWTQDSLLAFIVHELGHVQGICCGCRQATGAQISDMETGNQVATLEVLAGMCMKGHKYACKPLAEELRSQAMEYVRASVYDKPLQMKLFKLFARYVIYDTPEERARFDKSEMYWNQDQVHRDYRAYICFAYGMGPYYNMSRALDAEDLRNRSIWYPNVYKSIKLDDLRWFLDNLDQVAQIAGRESWPMRRWHGL